MNTLRRAIGPFPPHFLLPCAMALLLTAIPLRVSGQEADDKSADLDREISQLEQKRAAEALFSLELLTQKKDYARAAALATRALIIPPAEAESARLTELIEDVAFGLLRVATSPRKTAELCENAVEKLGENAILLYMEGLAYGEMGDETRQKESQRKAGEFRRNDQAYWSGVGSFFEKRGELETALEGYRAAAAISSDKPTHYNADSEASLASIYCRLGDYDEALRHCQNLREIATTIVVSRTNMAALTAMVYAERAQEKELEGNYEGAIEDSKRAAELSPSPGGAYHLIGNQYLKMKNYAEAEKWFDRALAAGAVPIACAGLGDVRKALGDSDGAEKEYAKSEAAFANAIETNPDNSSNYNNFAWYYATHDKELDKGIALVKEALELVPDSPVYLDTLAELYYRRGDRQAAIREIKKAIALHPPHIKYYRRQLEKFESEKSEQRREEPD